MLYRLWQRIVTEYELRMKIAPPTYPKAMKARLKQILGERQYRQYQLLAYLAGLPENDE